MMLARKPEVKKPVANTLVHGRMILKRILGVDRIEVAESTNWWRIAVKAVMKLWAQFVDQLIVDCHRLVFTNNL
jgi:hypothetical protein